MDISQLKKAIANQLLDYVESLSEAELVKLHNRTHEVKFKIAKIVPKGNRLSSNLSQHAIEDLVLRINSINTREEGKALLETILKNKKMTVQFAKYISVACMKEDKKEEIINRIVEATIGAKLKSQAIKGKE